MHWDRRLLPLLLLTLGLVFGFAGRATAQDGTGPTKQELDGAEFRLTQLEQKVKLARGQPIKLGSIEIEALKRIKDLLDRFPDHPQVKALFARAQQAVVASKGGTSELPPEALAYRENEQKLRAMFFEVAEKEWAAYRAKLEASGTLFPKSFPAPSHREVSVEEMVGRHVVLDNFYYPTNQFMDSGREFVSVGSRMRGYYYVEISNRAWLGAWEAVKRYRRFINQDVPEGMGVTLVGRVIGLDLLVPQAGEDKTLPAFWGWTVEPVAIYVPDRTFAVADPNAELGGVFAGEPTMEEIKSVLYTVKEIPADVTPERLVEIYATAIKEKNWPLYLDCIDPGSRQTPISQSLCLYHWDWHQHRFAAFYCHVTVNPARVKVTKGLDLSKENIETAFLPPEKIEELKKRAGPTVWEAELTTQAYDERGLQYGSPKPRYLRKHEGKRWYILNYAQPF
ncbi:MAG: hypothetical protein MUE73_07035 [Planctomycetes bacterium]|jgi:hypothetical protein|nr:hypothetical protein [Planctomycetota bacterium]